MPVMVAAFPTIPRCTCPGGAPSAMRTPISRVRAHGIGQHAVQTFAPRTSAMAAAMPRVNIVKENRVTDSLDDIVHRLHGGDRQLRLDRPDGATNCVRLRATVRAAQHVAECAGGSLGPSFNGK
jgi:hypothetical protein